MTTTTPPSYQPRVIEHGDAHEARPRFRLPEQWLRGLLAGAEALILSWLLVVVPAVATYVATAADPALGSAGWVQAAQVGTAGWFLAHGAVLGPGATGGEGFEISVVPLGATLLYVVLVATAVRRARLQSWAPVLVAVITYVTLASLLLSLVTVSAPAYGLIGAALVATLGSLWGVRGRNLPLPSWLAAVPQWLRVGWQGSWRAALLLCAAATAVTIAAIVVGFDQILQVHGTLHADPVSTVVIVFAQLLVVPLLVVWALAFLLGPGFAMGTGTIVSPSAIDVGPLPVVPVLAALPEPDSLAGDLPFLIAFGVVVGAGAGWWLVRRQRELPIWRSLAAAGVLVATITALVAATSWLASGAIGPGAMAQVGPDAAAVAWSACWQLAVGAVAGVVATHRDTRLALRTAWHWAREQVRTAPAPTES